MKTKLREKQWAEKYPDVGTGPLPTEPYVSQERFAVERDRIFRRCWINVGRIEEVPDVGDYFVRDIAICGASVLIIRGSDGVVSGFHNVCSHRSNALVLDERGSCPGRIHCHFHNWVYSDTGELVWVPDEENFFDLDKRDHGLTPVSTDIWKGFVFVHLDPEPAETLRDYLGGVADQLEGCPFGQMPLIQTYSVEERANWKVGLDAQNELYHFPFQHRHVAGDAFLTNDKQQIRYQDLRLYNYHSVWSCEYSETRSSTPLTSTLYKFDGVLRRAFEIPQMIGEMDFFTVFPNFVILLYQLGNSTSYLTYHFWPLAVDRTIWEIRIHFREAMTVRERLRQEYFKCFFRDTLQEDTAMHESVHRGLGSRAKSHLILQDSEIAIRHFHKVMADRIGSARLV